MAKDILREFGPDSPADQRARATSGGVTRAKPLPYSTPQGPLDQWHQGPGIGHVEPGYGTKGEEAGEETGRPGIGGGALCPQGKH